MTCACGHLEDDHAVDSDGAAGYCMELACTCEAYEPGEEW